MVNTNIQGAIPVAGPGFVARRSGWNNGEFRELKNLEVDAAGFIKPRRNIIPASYIRGDEGAHPATYVLANAFPIIGSMGPFVFTASLDVMRVHNSTVPSITGIPAITSTSWDVTSLPVNFTSGSFHRVLSCFYYNDTAYWITLEFNKSTDVFDFKLYYASAPEIWNPDTNSSDILNLTFAGLTATTIVSFTTTSYVGVPKFRNAFIFKDRLWLVLSEGVYFSAATDPTNFTPPDGGFFLFPDRIVNFAAATKDSIYVVTDSTTHVIDYGSDPNVDATVRQISGNIGGDCIAIHGDNAYSVDSRAIYSLTNFVEKVVDLELDVGENWYKHKIVSYEDYLVLVRYTEVIYNDLTGVGEEALRCRRFIPFKRNNENDYSCFLINLSTQSISVVGFRDNINLTRNEAVTGNDQWGYITDVHVNPNIDAGGNQRIYFQTNRWMDGYARDDIAHAYAAGDAYMSSLYTMMPRTGIYYDIFVEYDTDTEALYLGTKYEPNYLLEIDSYAPDGAEFLMKKWRSLNIMGNIPTTDFEVFAAYDNSSYSSIGTLNYTPVGEDRVPHPLRLPLMQRGRSLSLKIQSKVDDVILTDDVSGSPNYNYDPDNGLSHFAIHDLMAYWTYTGMPVPDKVPQ